MTRTFASVLVGSTALWIASGESPALAQSTSAPSSSVAPVIRANSRGLEEIIVTAQRVEKNLQRTPVAVTSFNATVLKERGVTTLLDLNALAPNISIGTRGGAGTASGDVTIRGIGVDANPPASPAVGIYIDDVYFPGGYGNLLGLFDVSRVEVLRGPQGTLFGRNTIAGAIQYVSVKPELTKYSGFVEDTVGNLNRNDISAGINIPIGSIAALRVSGGITDRNGYVHDVLNNVDRGSERTEQGRAQLRIRPNADLTIDLKGEFVEDRSNGEPTIPTAFNYNTILGGAYGPFGPFGPNGLDQYISHDDYTLAGLNAPDFARDQFRIAQGVITYRISDDLVVKSITAGSANESSVYVDQDRTPQPIIGVSRGDVNDRLFTQEIQIIGTSIYNRLHWQAGGYFFDDHATTISEVATIFGAPGNAFGNYVDSTVSYAGYGQATFDITKKISIVGGLRYTSEKALATDSKAAGAGKQTFTDLSPMFGLNYQVTPNLLFYFKDARGFRAGGFSPNAFSFNFFGPENATTYEGGARMEFLNRRLRVNPTIFVTDWNNIQFNSIAIVDGSPFPIIQNAGNANIKGAELELQGQVTDNFTMTASGSLLDGHYTTIGASQVRNITFGSGLKRSPQDAYTLGGRYELPLPQDRSIALAMNYAWQAHQRSSTTDGDNIPIGSYGLLSGRLEFKPLGDRLTLAVFATNITGEKYFIGGTNFGHGGLIPTVTADVGPPREYGLTGRINF